MTWLQRIPDLSCKPRKICKICLWWLCRHCWSVISPVSTQTSIGWVKIYFSGPPKQSIHKETVWCALWNSLPKHYTDVIKSLSTVPEHRSPGPNAGAPERARKKPDCLCLHRLNYPALLIKTADRSSALSARFSLWPWCKIPWLFLDARTRSKGFNNQKDCKSVYNMENTDTFVVCDRLHRLIKKECWLQKTEEEGGNQTWALNLSLCKK